MKNFTKNNTFTRAKAAALAGFEHVIDGDPDAFACIVSWDGVSERVQKAMEASFARLDYAEVNSVRLAGVPDDCVFALMESLDPMVLAIVDRRAAEALGKAYRTAVEVDGFGRLFGRSYVSFGSFEEDMGSEQLKQRNWAWLKTLKAKHS